MKRTILLSFLVLLGGVIAATNWLPTAHSNQTSQRIPSAAAPQMAAATPTAMVTPTTPAAPPVEPPQVVVQKASLDTRQAPVPLLMKPRAPVTLPATETTKTDGVETKSSEATADPAGDMAGQSAAKAAIEADGYKGVKVLNKGENGVWHATALRGRTTVSLTVDASGSVSAD